MSLLEQAHIVPQLPPPVAAFFFASGRASGVAAETITRSHAANPAPTRLMKHPATIAKGPASPESRRVGTNPTLATPMTSALAVMTKRA